MLAQPTSRLIAACTAFFRTVISTVILVRYAALVRWRPGVAELKRIFITTSFGRTVMAVVLALVSLTACSRPTPTQQVTLRIGVFRILDDLPYFVMQEQGFAKQHGLQFVEVSYQSGPAVIEAMAAGVVDAAANIGTAPVLAAAEGGLVPGTIMSVGASTFADPEHPAFAVLVAPSINRWKDLEGQYVAMNATNSHSAIAMRQRLHQEDVHATTLVITPMANMGLSVAGGNVAAAVMTEPWLTQSLLRGDGKLFGWVIGGAPFERVEHSMILFRTDLYRHNPQAVKAFLRAHLQAVRWIDQHPEQARSILAKWLGLSQEVAQKVQLLRWALEARNDPALLESVQSLLVEIGLLKARIPSNQLYDETLLEEVLAEKR